MSSEQIKLNIKILDVDSQFFKFWKLDIINLLRAKKVHNEILPLPANGEALQAGIHRVVRNSNIETQSQATLLISNYISDALKIRFYTNEDQMSPYKLWTNLCDYFEKVTHAQRLELQRELLELRIKDDEDPQLFIARTKLLVDRLSSANFPTSNEHFLRSLVDGLDTKKYKVLWDRFNADDRLPTEDEFLLKLKSYRSYSESSSSNSKKRAHEEDEEEQSPIASAHIAKHKYEKTSARNGNNIIGPTNNCKFCRKLVYHSENKCWKNPINKRKKPKNIPNAPGGEQVTESSSSYVPHHHHKCIWCPETGHRNNECAFAPICALCKQKGHTMNTCKQAPSNE